MPTMDRRRFLIAAAGALAGDPATGATAADARDAPASSPARNDGPSTTTLFLCGDVMTGRGIDQVLAHPSKPRIHEPYLRSALDYVALAEKASGPIRKPVDDAYVWGDALAELERRRPDARIVNLETAVTTSEHAWPRKGIHYRMHPANAGCLKAAAIDCCGLANNHVLDWGYEGLAETLATLRKAGIRTAGAGADRDEAAAPAIVDAGAGRRVLVLAYGVESAGVPREWAAQPKRAGVALLADLAPASAKAIGARVAGVKRPGDVAVASIHWGGNWGYDVPVAERAFARMLIDDAGIDVVHGHSSHHPKGIEVHRGRPILYGCGDFLNDYEGIAGHERWRAELGFMYFATLATGGALERLTLVPTRVEHFRVNRVHGADVDWLAATMSRECERFDARVERQPDDTLIVRAQ